MHCIYFTIMCFIAEILLNLDHVYQSGLTVDYGEYFKLTVDLYFDCGHSLEYRL